MINVIVRLVSAPPDAIFLFLVPFPKNGKLERARPPRKTHIADTLFSIRSVHSGSTR